MQTLVREQHRRATAPPPARAGEQAQARHAPLLRLQATAGNQATAQLLRSARAQDAAGIAAARLAHPALLRFGSKEHRSLGDTPTGGAAYDMGGGGSAGAPTGGLELSHGDIVMLSGDYFDPRDTLRDGDVEKPNPDSLFKIAGQSSGAPGAQVGSRDEVMYAIYDVDSKDPRFAPGGSWDYLWAAASARDPDSAAGYEARSEAPFSKDVKKVVKDRYLNLASKNIEHFASPAGRQGSAADPVGSSALGSYRGLHEVALHAAFEAGQNGAGVAMPLAREAAAQHFLTDAFAAGHVRTPRASIREHWASVYPLFWSNLRKKIALDVARYINSEQTNAGTIFGTVAVIYDKVYKKVMEKTATKPPFGFDNLVALVAHDLDNEQGIVVENDRGDEWTAYGDSHLDDPNPTNRTRELAQDAVAAGNADVHRAHRFGQVAPGFMGDDAISAEVRAGGSGVAPGKYDPETYVPHVEEDVEGEQNWKVGSLDELWELPVRTDMPGVTYGGELDTAVRTGDIKKELTDMAEEFPIDERAVAPDNSVANWITDLPGLRNALGILDTREAYLEGFLAPIISDPKSGLRSIIDFDPSEGQAWFNEDDAAREELEGMKPDEIAQLTLNQKADRIKAIIDGTFNYVDGDDGELVISLFAATPAAERALLYRLVEGHAWKGDWIEGWWVDDDELWNALSDSQLSRLRGIINGSE